jgi:hypothetical protein
MFGIGVNPQPGESFQLSVHSTAEALIFLNSAIVVPDSALSNLILGILHEMPQTDTLVMVIEDLLAANPRDLDDGDTTIKGSLYSDSGGVFQKSSQRVINKTG